MFFIKQKTAYEMRISDWSSDVCSSDLKTLIATSPRTPAISSLKRIWIGWVISNAPPGMLSRTVSTFATRSALDRPLSGHSLFGFMMMNVSEMLGGIGSHASSAVPVFEKTNRTSGRSEEHPYELQSLMRISDAVFCLKKKT